MQTKYIFVTGGVVSSLGKGLTAASIAMLLERKGLKVAMMKLDPYLNVDPGTMSPYQHGEVYVTDDGAETDLDLGHYYRMTHSPLSRLSNATSGQIYDEVIKRERRGDYLGKTIQVIPHITDEIKRRILLVGKQTSDTHVVMVEIGGTVGDIEGLPFLEAIRQFRQERPQDCLNIHLTYVPFLQAAGEVKTKPTQHSVQALRQIGIFPDIILCRSEKSLPADIKEKISLFCSVAREAVFEAVDVKKSIYELPLNLHLQGIDQRICELFHLTHNGACLDDWKAILNTLESPKGQIEVGIVGKYVAHQDAYKSVVEALQHGALAAGYSLNLRWIESDKIFDHGGIESLQGCDGYLVPGGFGERGWSGKILTAQHCREHRVPYFGICLGMQVLVTEFARHVAGLAEANSTEVDPNTKDPVISLLSEQQQVQELGGTMRLGSYPCSLKENSLAAKAYGSCHIEERHRHRYEFHNKYKPLLESKGLVVSGVWEEGNLAEVVEVAGHPWMLGVQSHPEFKSKPTEPHPLFASFIEAVIAYKEGKR